MEEKTGKPVGIFIDKGKLSFSRITGAVVVAVFLLLNIISVLKSGVLVDMPANFAMLTGGFYGLNVLKGFAKAGGG